MASDTTRPAFIPPHIPRPLSPIWPLPHWQDHCGNPECETCNPEQEIPPENYAAWLNWTRANGN